MEVAIKVPGEPVAQPRQRHTRTGINYVPRNHPVHGFKETLRLLAREQCEYHMVGVVMLEIEAVFTRPKYLTKKRGENPRIPHTKKPDSDNVCKAVMDALIGVAYRDDSQVWLSVCKWIAAGGEEPHTVVKIRCM